MTPVAGRFSPLTGITPANVGTAGGAWTYHMDPTFGRQHSTGTALPACRRETTPLEVDGVIYLGTPYGRVVALDAVTGKEIWAYDLPTGKSALGARHLPIGRATASWALKSFSAPWATAS